MVEVFGLDIARQAINRVIRHRDGVCFGIIRDHGQHRAKDFFACDRGVVGVADKHGWTDEIALVEAFRATHAAGHQSGFFHADFDQGLNLLELATIGQRAHGKALVARRIRHHDRFCRGFRNCSCFAKLCARHKHASWRVARLARIGHDLHDARRNSLLNVGIF